jgi:succinylarginine dihydrolase
MMQADQEQMRLVSAIHHGANLWTAEAATVNGQRLVALRLTDGALVYLHPDIAKQLGERLLAAATS